MKINWGWGIAIFLSLFLTAIISFVIFSTTQQVNLVEKNYYPKGVIHEQQIEKQRNTNKLSDKIVVSQSPDSVTIVFPQEMKGQELKGTLLFSHIENYKLDKKYSIQSNAIAQQVVSKRDIKNGRYIIKIEWETAIQKYYQEINIRIQ